jgi:hypothetical protein
LAHSSPRSLLRSPVTGATRRWHCSADRWQHLFYPAPLSLLDVDVAGECWVYFECDPSRTLSHLIEVRHLHQRRSLLPLGYSITGSGKGVDVKAFKIAAFRDSMRRQYASRTLQVEWTGLGQGRLSSPG